MGYCESSARRNYLRFLRVSSTASSAGGFTQIPAGSNPALRAWRRKEDGLQPVNHSDFQNLQRAPQRRLAARPEAGPSGDINTDRDRTIDLEVRVEPLFHHAAAGLALEERRSRRACSRSKSFLRYLTSLISGSQIFLRRLPAVAVSLPAG